MTDPAGASTAGTSTEPSAEDTKAISKVFNQVVTSIGQEMFKGMREDQAFEEKMQKYYEDLGDPNKKPWEVQEPVRGVDV